MKMISQANGMSRVAQALALAYGHEDFMRRNTGQTDDGHIQHYIQNTDGVLSNNRHFIADTMSEYQPNGDGTTEGQALHIIGYCHMYLATRDERFLDAAIHAWEAYIKYYYNGQPIPDTSQRYICNWLVNSKEPVLAHYPVHPEKPTQGGYKCVPLNFVNGVAQIPHGAPFWGEYLDVATIAHRGHMTWDSINASVQKIQENVDGKIDWDAVYNKFRIIGDPVYEYRFQSDFNGTGTSAIWTSTTPSFGKTPYTNGWAKPLMETTGSYPPGMRYDISPVFVGSNYDTVLVKIKKTGNPTWAGAIRWVTDSTTGWDDVNRIYKITEPEYDENGIAEITVKPNWTGNIRCIRLDLAARPASQTDYNSNYFEVDYFYLAKKIGNKNVSEAWSSMAWIDWPAYLGYPSYTVQWGGSSSKEDTYSVSWVNVWTKNKIGIGRGPDDQLWSGDIIETDIPDSEIGMVKLEDETINGVYLFNYAVRLPVELGGYMFARNEPWHNRPVHAPFLGSVNQLGNAADAEVWFIDSCYLLWRITGEARFKKALDCCFFTAHEYTYIDSVDRFFRQSITANTPFTDGISYAFSYPELSGITYGRDDQGYITIHADQSSQHFLEQQSVWFRVDKNSSLRVTYGGVGESGSALGCKAMLDVSAEKKETESPTWYGLQLPQSVSMEPVAQDIPISSLALMTNPNTGDDYLMAEARAVTDYGGCSWSEAFESGVHDGRSATVINAHFPDDNAGFIIGFWLASAGGAKPQSIVYRADADFNMRLDDDNKWKWWWMLPATNGEWAVATFDPADATLSGYQPDHSSDEAKPTAPVFDNLLQITILLDSSTTDSTFSYYVVNDVPPLFSLDNGWTMTYRMALSCTEQWNGVVGDCTIIDYRLDSLAYCPGTIPFSNIYEEGTDQIGAWHGMPYPGYQYPFMYTIHADTEKYSWWLENQIAFLWDSQQAYQEQVGELGPGCAAYIWNRWDNYKYGTADTWTTFHWGDGKPWAGYQCRAYNAAARAWYELVLRGQPVPDKLKEYVENWAVWLVGFSERSGGHTPNEFPVAPNKAVWVENDFTAHMCALWLAGSCYALMAGSKIEGLEGLAEDCVRELSEGFTITDIVDKNINGTWSPAARVESDNGMYFGFYTGEAYRALGLYIMYKKHGAGYDMYVDCTIPDHKKGSL